MFNLWLAGLIHAVISIGRKAGVKFKATLFQSYLHSVTRLILFVCTRKNAEYLAVSGLTFIPPPLSIMSRVCIEAYTSVFSMRNELLIMAGDGAVMHK